MNTKNNVFNNNVTLSFQNKIKKMENKNDKIINTYEDESLCGNSVQCKLFNNTWIVYYDLKVMEPEILTREENGSIRMNYCISGRCELTYKNNKVIYIGKGDFITALLDTKSYKHDFPLGIYKGVSIVTSFEDLDEFLSKMFCSTKINIKSLAGKFEHNDRYLLFSNNEKVKLIVEQIMYLKDNLWREKSIVALMQLIVFLFSDDIDACKKDGKYIDVNLSYKIKEIKKEVTQNLEKYVSIEEVSQKYNISERTFSDCFKEIYGNTYYSFIKEYRIKKAAELLITSDDSITEIALSVGYQNPGKFSKVFKEIMGITPLKFRKREKISN